jgi:simple sugar transport system substrate-binding protein
MNLEPLVRRDEVWEAYKIDNDWTQVFFVEDAANYTSADALRSAIEMAISGSPRPPSFIYAPWDYLSINTVKAIDSVAATNGSSNASRIGVYGADVNDEDIAVMTAPGSQWLATAGGDPRGIGASLVRMVALSMAGELSNVETEEGGTLTIPTTLITQDFLATKNIASMDILVEAMPELQLQDFMRACWIGFIKPVTSGSTTDDATSASSVVKLI